MYGCRHESGTSRMHHESETTYNYLRYFLQGTPDKYFQGMHTWETPSFCRGLIG